jgi:hypothetical protein
MLYILITGLAILLIGIIVALVLRSRKSKSETIEDLEKDLQTGLKDSATELVKAFKWYFTYDPKKPIKDQSPFNRQKRRRIERHYEKFLWAWFDIPNEIRDVEKICHYLAGKDWKTNVVQRYVKAHLEAKHFDGWLRTVRREKAEREEERKRILREKAENDRVITELNKEEVEDVTE